MSGLISHAGETRRRGTLPVVGLGVAVRLLALDIDPPWLWSFHHQW